MKNYYNKLTMTFPVGWAENGQLFRFLMPDTTVLMIYEIELPPHHDLITAGFFSRV